MPPEVFEPAIPASERPQIHALDRAATGISPTDTILSFIGYLKCSVFLPPTLTHCQSPSGTLAHSPSQSCLLPSMSLKASSM
jgi:hypothetical protein